ncbi:MAG: anaerobic ribonucleoside-triphosphate reductase activating protein [Armatimonadota bacterium]
MPGVDELRIGGLLPMTTVEWEGHLAAVLFLQGCPWRCRYCHNTGLVSSRTKTLRQWDEIWSFLQERQGLLDAVVFSGGEPTAQAALPAALTAVKELGYLVALHTNGYNTASLGRALATGAVDYVAMDVKAPFSRYEEVTQIAGSGRKAQRSATAIIKSGVAHEFRTTYHSDLLTPDDLRTIAEDLQWRGAQAYYLQRYRDDGSPDMPLTLSMSAPPPEGMLRDIEKMLPKFGTRGW